MAAGFVQDKKTREKNAGEGRCGAHTLGGEEKISENFPDSS
jgi:uncharacterized low-complexity protein